jgi:hypothetical protein
VHNFYSSPNIIRIKIYGGWDGRVCSMHGREDDNVLFGKLKGRDHLEDKGVDGRIILKYGVKLRNGLIWLKIGIAGGL